MTLGTGVTWDLRRMIIVLPLLACLSCVAPMSHAADPDPLPLVVILNSYHQGYDWSDREIAGLLEGLHSVYPDLAPVIEHLDTKRFPSESHQRRLAAFLADKYRDQSVDLVIALDNPALDLLRRYRIRILADSVPAVFAGVNDFHPDLLAGWRNVTGIAEVQDHHGTLELALRLHPDTRQVLAVHDYTTSGMAVQREVVALRSLLKDQVRIDFTPPATWDEAAAQIAALPPDSLALILSFATDRAGESLTPSLSTERLTAQAKVPVYATHATRLGNGIVGGLLIGGEEHGRRAAALALRVLAGEDPANIPVEMDSTSLPMFDYRQLERFAVPLSALPADSIIINRPISFYEQNKLLVWAVAAIVSVLSGLVTALAVLLVRERRAQRARQASEERYRRIVETANEGIWAMDAQHKTSFVNQHLSEMLGYTAEEMLGRPVTDFMFEDDLDGHRQRMAARHQGEGGRYEQRFRRADGSACWLYVSATPVSDAVSDDGGRFAGSFAMFTDITERKHAEEALQRSEERLRLMVEHLPMGAVYTDGDAVYVNQATEAITGYSRSDLTTTDDWFARLYGDDAPGVRGMYEEDRRTGFLSPRTVSLTRKDGQRRLVEFFAHRHERGDVWLLSDVTERSRAVQALRESEARYRQLLETLQEGIWVIDPDARTSYVNPRMADMLGYTVEEMLGRHLFDFVDPSQIEIAQTNLERRRRGIKEQHDFEFVHKNGHRVYTALETAPLLDEQGTYLGGIAGIMDITERRKAEQALRESEEQLRLFYEQAPLGYQSLDENGCFVDLNQAWLDLLGYRREEVIGRWFGDFLVPEFRELFAERFSRFKAIGEVHGVEFGILHRNGTRLVVAFDGTIGRDRDGHFRQTHCIMHNITERKQAEEARQQLQAQLLQSQKMEAVGRLTAGIAHDFNNMLTAIIGFADLIQLQLLPGDPLNEPLGRILEAGQNAANLVRQLMAFSRQQVLQPKIVDLNEVVRGLDQMLRRVIGEDVTLEVQLPENLWPVKVDPSSLQQVIVNLAVNARDAMPHGGRLLLETADVMLDADYAAAHVDVEPGDYVRLVVTDTGCGMSPEVQAHIFEPFFTTKPSGKGTGLGLSTVYGIIRQSGGYIAVVSQPGRGTVFTVYLPRTFESTPASGESRMERSVLRGTETILVVEDTAQVREFTCDLLRLQGYRVLEADNGEAALRVAAGHSGPIHLLLTDVVMPTMSGKALADQLKSIRSDMKVVFTSGYTDDVRTTYGTLAPGLEFLPKPFSAFDLMRKVRQVLTSSPNTTISE